MMYQTTMGALPRQLTPPSWLRNAISQHVGAVVKGTTLSIPTDSGTISFDLSDPKQWAAIGKMLTGVRISRQPAQPAGGGDMVSQNVPGGWLTMGLIGVGLYLLAFRRR